MLLPYNTCAHTHARSVLSLNFFPFYLVFFLTAHILGPYPDTTFIHPHLLVKEWDEAQVGGATARLGLWQFYWEQSGFLYVYQKQNTKAMPGSIHL